MAPTARTAAIVCPRGSGLSTYSGIVFFRINEISDLINTCADHWTGASYVTLALSGPVSKCDLPRLRDNTREQQHDKADLRHPRGTTQDRHHFDSVVFAGEQG